MTVPLCILLASLPAAPVFAEVVGDGEAWVGAPIHYEEEAREDRVSDLRAALADGTASPTWDENLGWLPAVLEEFGVLPSSQVLVFSKTSFQPSLISPATPRALYFGDDVYLGWVPGAPVMEITSIDPVQGATFYTLDQDPAGLRFVRKDEACLDCHGSPRTHDWPGNLVRSVHPGADGEPILSSGTFRTTDASPLSERWGGWYVTGTHGDQRHMGNTLVNEEAGERFVSLQPGANLTDLSQLFDVTGYLVPHSDIVALMVLEHQAEMHNVIARASYEARLAAAYQLKMNRFFDEPPEHVSDSTRRRYRHAAERVVDHLLFRCEAGLEGQVRGTSCFSGEFAAAGRRDGGGRSLRDFDLQRRLFRFPCSFLIHSRAFEALPPTVLEVVWSELWDILAGREVSRDFSHLSGADRAAILAILRATHSGLPDSWRSAE
ncbi:MAG: hypothetical protein ABGY71_05910 [bacterium]|nr:hypothetical protein [Planctomycetota bacterium]HIL51499.1 hypothetical protein [Planctomycetota bacterium]